MNLFLDDERHPYQVKWVDLPLVDWVIVRSYDEFVRYIQTHGVPTRVSFDYDLADEHYPFTAANQAAYASISPTALIIPYDKYKEKTGYDAAKWLVEYCLQKNIPFPETYIHTMNPLGKANIKSLVDSFWKVFDKR